jgi:methylenetetrahydrofolate dehydrogenase (NADP+)/methenyltetrahydrofolate cyclohydrolase/formyltetrahydrofolate synthetase
MAAAKIDGTAIAKSIRGSLKDEIENIQVTNPRFKPSLVIFQGMSFGSNNGKKICKC